jgi:hypothetical protein
MRDISPEFNWTDALLLYSIAYCQRHNYQATLGRILLTTDAINRTFPIARELEDGLSRLIVGGYIEIQGDLFAVTESGVRLFNDVTHPQNQKLNVFEEIEILEERLSSSPIRSVSKQLTITNTKHVEAIQEAYEIFKEVSKKADEITRARKANEQS